MANTTIKQHVPIFISSTYEDLVPYRDEVQRVIMRLEQVVKGMEYFGSSPDNPLEVCLRQVRESRVFIGIIGMRYGSINEEKNLSFSELEYNEAMKANIPTLIYIIDEDYPIPSKYVDKGESAERLEEFKKQLKKKHTVSCFTSPADLGNKLSHDLVETLSNLEQIKIDSISDVSNNIEFCNTFKKFLLRPKKYSREHGELTMRIVSKFTGRNLKDQIIKSFGLVPGDTISCDVDIYDNNGDILIKEFDLYADGNSADWLEEATIGTTIVADVQLVFCTFQEVSIHDTGRLLRDTSYCGIVLLKGKTITLPQNN